LDNEPQRRLDQAPTAALNARFRLLKTQLQAAFGQMASEDAAVSKPAYAKSMDLLHGMQDVGLALQKWNGRVAQFAGWSVPCFGVLAATSIAPGAWVAVMIARRRALKRGCCRTCGYDLIGNASGVCPECGTIIGLNEATTKVASNTKG
jgi:hypothetical protein